MSKGNSEQENQKNDYSEEGPFWTRKIEKTNILKKDNSEKEKPQKGQFWTG